MSAEIEGALARSVGAAVREARARRGMSLAQAAAASSLTPAGLSNLERGRSNPTLSTLSKICDVLGLEVSLLPRDAAQQDR